MKKKFLIDKFLLYAYLFNSKSELLSAAWRIIHELGIENGAVIEDFDKSDFEETSVSDKRRDQITNAALNKKTLSATMLANYITSVGKKKLDEVRNKTESYRKNKDDESTLVMRNFSITKKTFEKIKKFSELTGKSNTDVAEDAINYYCDLDDSEK